MGTKSKEVSTSDSGLDSGELVDISISEILKNVSFHTTGTNFQNSEEILSILTLPHSHKTQPDKSTKKRKVSARDTDQAKSKPASKKAKGSQLLESIISSSDSEALNNKLSSKGYRDLSTELGTGGYGAVQLIENVTTRELFALKIVKYDRISKNLAKEEEETWRELCHENIIPLIQCFQVDSSFCFISRLAEDGDLYKHIRRLGVPPVSTTKSWVNQVANALRYMHLEKLTAHRDVKLKNIFLTESGGRILLGDFGLSVRLLNPADTCSERLGTPGHIPPEVLLGESYNPFLYDVWTLGVISYHLLVGELPFDRYAPLATMVSAQKSLNLPFKLLNKKDQHAEGFVRQALTYLPSHRPSINKLINHPFLHQQ